VRLVASVASVVTVLDPEGAPVPGAMVSVHAHVPTAEDPVSEPKEAKDDGSPDALRERLERLRRASRATRHLGSTQRFAGSTGPDGRLRVTGLDPAQVYDLVVNGSSRRDLEGEELSAWSPRDVTITLRREEDGVRVRVRRKDGTIEEDPVLWSPGIGAWRAASSPTRLADGTLFLSEGPSRHLRVVATPRGRLRPVDGRGAARVGASRGSFPAPGASGGSAPASTRACR
jgi:hypothetical protein